MSLKTGGRCVPLTTCRIIRAPSIGMGSLMFVRPYLEGKSPYLSPQMPLLDTCAETGTQSKEQKD